MMNSGDPTTGILRFFFKMSGSAMPVSRFGLIDVSVNVAFLADAVGQATGNRVRLGFRSGLARR
jgi:hypothetical protein